MKQVILGSIAGLASVAAAQSASFSIVPSATVVDCSVTTSFTLSVYADADFGTAIAGGEVGLMAVGGDGVLDVTAEAAAWGAGFQNDRGHDGSGGHNGLVFGQLIFPPILPPHPNSTLPGLVLVGVFTVTIPINSGGTLIDWTTTGGQGPFALEVFDDADSSFTQLTDVQHGGASMFICPSPSSCGVFILAGLVGVRRRR